MVEKLNFGCGETWGKYHPEYQGVDIVNFGQKYVTDANSLLIEKLRAGEPLGGAMGHHFLEHLSQDEIRDFLNNLWGLLGNGNTFDVIVPSIRKDKAWVLSHKTFFTEETLRWLGTGDATVHGFMKWEVTQIGTNERQDIHCLLTKQL